MGGTRTYPVDLDRLQQCGEDGEMVMRLMIAVNDINLAMVFAERVQSGELEAAKHEELAIRRYFIQLQCGHLSEALQLVKEVEKRPELRRFIERCSHSVRDAYSQLLECIPGGDKHKDFIKYISQIRNRAIFHYYSIPVKKAITDSQGRLGNRRSTITLGSDPTLGRFDVADDIIDSIVCRQLWKIPPSADVQAEANRIADWGWELCQHFLCFAYELAHTYMRENALAK